MLNIIIHLPNGLISKVKGRVIWALRSHNGNVIGTSVKAFKNGMGVEIIKQDNNFLHFVSLLEG